MEVWSKLFLLGSEIHLSTCSPIKMFSCTRQQCICCFFLIISQVVMTMTIGETKRNRITDDESVGRNGCRGDSKKFIVWSEAAKKRWQKNGHGQEHAVTEFLTRQWLGKGGL